MNRKRAWIYCRIAYPNAAFLEIQEKNMIDYAKAQGLSIAGVTSEHGSGHDFSRDGMKAVSHAIEAGGVDVLLVKDLSRLGRDMEEMDVFLRWLKKHNVTLVCADGTMPQTYEDMLRCLIGEFERSRKTSV